MLADQSPASPTPNASVLLAKVFYFFYYAAGAALIPFLVLYYHHLGLSGERIGLLAGIPPLMTLLCASLWGGLADATQQHRRLLKLAITGTLASALLLSTIRTFWALIPAVLGYAFFIAPVIPLVDNSVLDLLGDRPDRYGTVRLWGAVGWGAAAPIAGRIVQSWGLSASFYTFAFLMSACLLVSVRLPVARAHIGGAFRDGLRLLLRSREWYIFLAILFAGGMGLAVVHNFLFLYMEDLGSGPFLMGTALTVSTLSELVVFFLSSRLLTRLGTRRLLLFALLALAIRLFAYSTVRTPWLVLPVQLLHGPSFAAIWVAGVSQARKLAPKGLGATAQGLLSGALFGLGSSAGALTGGALYEHLGPFSMFRWAGLWVFLVLAFYAVAGRRARAQTA